MLLLRELLAKSASDTSLYGRFYPEEHLTQVLSTRQEFKGTGLQKLGRLAEGVIYLDGLKFSVRDGRINILEDSSEQNPEILVFDLDEYHKRNRGLVLSEKARDKAVLSVGAGSVGVRITEALLKHGVHVHQVDCDSLEIHNFYRWGLAVIPELCVARSKVHVAKETFERAIPGARITAHHKDFSEDFPFFETLAGEKRFDLMVVTTDTMNSHRNAMILAHRQKIPILYVLLGDKAETGMIAYYAPEHDCCHLCFTSGSQDEDLGVNLKKDNKQYGIDAEKEQHGVPALSVDISIVSSIGAKIALAILAGEDVSQYFTVFGNTGNVIFFSTKPDAWIMEDAFQKLCVQVEKNPECPLCGTPNLERIKAKHAKVE